jgi:hypothetical protein
MIIIERRRLGFWAGSALIASAFMPLRALADDGDNVSVNNQPEGSREVAIKSTKHKEGPPTADFLKYDWHIDFQSDKVAEVDWKDDFPEHGHANILLDNKGNWQFQGSFPHQPLKHKCRVTVGVGLKSPALGKVLAAVHTMTLDHDGASWDKSGHDAIVGDLWKDTVKGHEWVWSAHFRQERPHEPPPPPDPHGPASGGNSSGGDSTGEEVGDDFLKTLAGPIGFFL